LPSVYVPFERLRYLLSGHHVHPDLGWDDGVIDRCGYDKVVVCGVHAARSEADVGVAGRADCDKVALTAFRDTASASVAAAGGTGSDSPPFAFEGLHCGVDKLPRFRQPLISLNVRHFISPKEDTIYAPLVGRRDRIVKPCIEKR
jgi:hypothetical protein